MVLTVLGIVNITPPLRVSHGQSISPHPPVGMPGPPTPVLNYGFLDLPPAGLLVERLLLPGCEVQSFLGT